MADGRDATPQGATLTPLIVVATRRLSLQPVGRVAWRAGTEPLQTSRDTVVPTIRQWILGLFIAAVSPMIAGAQPPDCVVKHDAFVQGGVAQGQMRLVNSGKACNFTFKFAGNFEPNTWKVEEAPRHGRVTIEGSTVGYVPEAGYAGPDTFTVAVFGYNPMLVHRKARDGRFQFNVDVRPTRWTGTPN